MLKGFIVFLLVQISLFLFLPFLVLSSHLLDSHAIDPILMIYHHEEERVMELSLEDYLRGVVAAEMPASFPMEALKAQAVVSRTYALARYYSSIGEDVHITTDSTIHQCWLSTSELFYRWGPRDFLTYLYRIVAAIDATRGEVLTYQGNLIQALYHANAGGKTEDPLYLWENSIPYLQSIQSPWDAQAPRFHQVHLFSFEELTKILGLSLSSPLDLMIMETSPSGRVQEVMVGGERLTGTLFRNELNLPSTLFTIDGEGSYVRIETKGHGHGVGMSQYGAKGMAEEGYHYHEILGYYYRGVSLTRMVDLCL